MNISLYTTSTSHNIPLFVLEKVLKADNFLIYCLKTLIFIMQFLDA